MSNYETHDFDVIVIGAGGAGLRAAIEASAMGTKTALICKSLLGKAHTVMAEGGMAAALANVASDDNWEVHFHDTIHGGKFMGHWKMALNHAKEAPERALELERWGAVFDRTKEGKINQRAFGGHTYNRLAHVGDRTGLEMIRTLQDRGVHQGIEVFMEHTVASLLKSDGRVTGAFAYDRETGKFMIFRAKATVLATGGIGKMFKVTSNSWEYTADGHALGLNAGAELLDSEFVQFHPTGMVWPPGVKGILVTEAVRGEGGRLTNAKGERFMENYDKERMELSTRDIVSKAIYNEVKEGRGTEHGGVWLDISHREPDYIKKKLPSMYHQFKELADVDITKAPMEIGPTLHYTMGGVKVDPDSCESTVPGLYAAGEVAGGMHGANRLGGNSLSDLLVFGKRAGEHAAEFATSQQGFEAVDERQVAEVEKALVAPFESDGKETPYDVQFELQDMMSSQVGIMRVADDLKAAIARFPELKERARKARVEGSRMYNNGWHLSWDLHNMLDVAEVIARCALQREESRGAHTRLDFPKTDKEKWEKVNSIASKRPDGAIEVGLQPKPQMPDDLWAIVERDPKAGK
jgi:succinate dehydrogenase / fumarate reductase flavoprotein subunit